MQNNDLKTANDTHDTIDTCGFCFQGFGLDMVKKHQGSPVVRRMTCPFNNTSHWVCNVPRYSCIRTQVQCTVHHCHIDEAKRARDRKITQLGNNQSKLPSKTIVLSATAIPSYFRE